ncbi:MAG: helix-turn-helix transcriptional regulator [Clostridia bacterium]|nr:helix-turn-helix transcriptional regulator [Clostridia bacterium]
MAEKIVCAHERTPKPSMEERMMHSHDNYEVYYLLSGDADFLVEATRYHLRPGDLLLMRKGEVHMFRLRSAAPYERMHINFDISPLLSHLGMTDLLTPFLNRPLGAFNHYPAALFTDRSFQQDLERVCNASEENKLLYLLPLLAELKEAFETLKEKPASPSPDRASAIVSYINAHLSQELSLEELSHRFFLSQTHLNRIFRAATGTTVWQYITIKRLYFAKELLEEGKKPTEVAPLCGFKDYTTFFRAYKKLFGSAPCGRETKKSAELPF